MMYPYSGRILCELRPLAEEPADVSLHIRPVEILQLFRRIAIHRVERVHLVRLRRLAHFVERSEAVRGGLADEGGGRLEGDEQRGDDGLEVDGVVGMFVRGEEGVGVREGGVKKVCVCGVSVVGLEPGAGEEGEGVVAQVGE